MDKKFILNTINDSIVVEELAIPIYKKHLESALFWSGFSTEDEEYIKNSLNKLTSESQRHIQILTILKEKIEKGI